MTNAARSLPERKTVDSEERPRRANVEVEVAIEESITVVILE